MKRNLRNIAFLLVFTILLAIVAGLSGKCTSNTLPPIKNGNSDGDTVDVAVIYGPFGYFAYKDTIKGLNYDLLMEFSKATDTPLKLWPVADIDIALNKIEEGTFNLFASLPSDNNIKDRFLTSQSIFLDRLVLIQRTDTSGNLKVNSILDLKDDSVHVLSDSPALHRLENLKKEIGGNINLIPEKSISEELLCIKVATGIVNLAVVNENTAKNMNKLYPELSINNPISFTQFQVWIFPITDTILQNRVNTWIENFRSTPQYEKIIESYKIL